MSLSAKLFAVALDVISKRPKGDPRFGSAISTVFRYPIRSIAAFFAAPFLAFRVARSAENPFRRVIAGLGLFIALIAAWFVGTLIGTLAATVLIMSKVGVLVALGFLVGTYLSVVLSVSFQIVVFNLTSLLFLHMSSEEVADYLKKISE